MLYRFRWLVIGSGNHNMKFILEEWMKTQDFALCRHKQGSNARYVKANTVRKANTAKRHKDIKDVLAAHPNLSTREIAERLGYSLSLVYSIRKSSETINLI